MARVKLSLDGLEVTLETQDNVPPERGVVMQRHRRSFHEFGHAHELTFSCYRRFQFFRTERPCQWLKEAIDSARSKESFLVWAYVFIPDHVHLLVLPTSVEVNVGRILKSIKSPVARRALQYVKEHSPEWLPKLSSVDIREKT